VLVVFAIRTRRRFFESRPHRLIIVMAFGVVALASVLPFLPVGSWLGFVTPPPLFYIYLISVTVAYLALVETVKQVFYRFIAER
jgi:Mg2+-importing ATPase